MGGITAQNWADLWAITPSCCKALTEMISARPPLLSNFSTLAGRYDVLLCDVWGVVHDGQRAFAGANDALSRFRAKGGTVVLVSNAPMPSDDVARLLDEKGVLQSAWDALVTSGDIALRYIAASGYARVYGIGPLPRDDCFFDRLPTLARFEDADSIACTGLIDDQRETADTYRPILTAALTRRLPFVCANPDLAVHVGAHLLPCAGAIADLYERMGGEVIWCGKPHASAYAAGLETAARIRGGVAPLSRVLGIGDAVRTDLAAAAGAGVDGLFVASGLHRDETMAAGDVDLAAVEQLLTAAAIPAVGVMASMVW